LFDKKQKKNIGIVFTEELIFVSLEAALTFFFFGLAAVTFKKVN
jgi:hypothetical protein